ncbi:MAG: sigma-70 family RNA polymerase sigma factor [Candidatus Brocadiia bacterium]|nr:MAG: sigma-70 family RNA polymerase sigma factor [Candidatus Brocadiia bacterium]
MNDSYRNESDGNLVEYINRGEAEAFEVLYFRYRDWIYNLARRFTGNDDQALDVLQETFIYLMKKFPGFKLTSQMTTFLYPAVKNISIAVCRNRKRFVSSEELRDDIPAEEELCNERSKLEEVLSGLDEQNREILLMRFVDQMKLEEIAIVMGISPGMVKSRFYRALAFLREDERTRKYFLE